MYGGYFSSTLKTRINETRNYPPLGFGNWVVQLMNLHVRVLQNCKREKRNLVEANCSANSAEAERNAYGRKFCTTLMCQSRFQTRGTSNQRYIVIFNVAFFMNEIAFYWRGGCWTNVDGFWFTANMILVVGQVSIA